MRYMRMDKPRPLLYKTVMALAKAVPYFRDLEFGAFDHVPRCGAWIDRDFPHYWALNFACTGRIAWAMGGENETLTTLPAPVAWWTWPGPRFRYGCRFGETWDHYYVTFHGSRARRMFAEGLLPDYRESGPAYIPVTDADAYRREWEALFADLRSGGLQSNPDAVHRLEGMLLRLRRQPILALSDADAAFLTELRTLADAVRMDPARAWDWNHEARSLGVSVVHLRRRFREVLGAPPHRFLLQARMETAARLLRTGDAPIKAVAAAVGIPDTFYFCKRFKAYSRLSPNRYRLENRIYSLSAESQAD